MGYYAEDQTTGPDGEIPMDPAEIERLYDEQYDFFAALLDGDDDERDN